MVDSCKDAFRTILAVKLFLAPLVIWQIICKLFVLFSTTNYLANYLYVNLMLFFEGMEYKGSSMAIQSSRGCQYWVGQSE